MPEKMTKEEAKISQAIRAVRKAKELLQEEGRNTLPYDADEAKEMKIKTPKAVKADKITNQTQKKEGFGLAGEVFGKKEFANNREEEEWGHTAAQLGAMIHKIRTTMLDYVNKAEEYVPFSGKNVAGNTVSLSDTIARVKELIDELNDFYYD